MPNQPDKLLLSLQSPSQMSPDLKSSSFSLLLPQQRRTSRMMVNPHHPCEGLTHLPSGGRRGGVDSRWEPREFLWVKEQTAGTGSLGSIRPQGTPLLGGMSGSLSPFPSWNLAHASVKPCVSSTESPGDGSLVSCPWVGSTETRSGASSEMG